MPRLFQRKNGTWTEIKSVFQRQSGTWVEMLNIFQRISGTWTKVFSGSKVPGNTIAPTITGSGYLFATLTNNSLGTWTNTPTSYARQWRRGTPPAEGGEPQGYSNISGETSSTYTTTSNDNGKYVVCQVTATNGIGSNAVSSNSIYISKYPPVSLQIYTLSGAALVGSTLTAEPQSGSWKNTTTNTGDTFPDSFEYEWSYPDGTIRQSLAYNSINSSSYLIVTGDLGKTIRVRVTGKNSGGETTSGYTSSAEVTSNYSFNFGNTLYVGSNGYITLDQAPSSAIAALPAGNGRTINIWNEDLVNYRIQEYSDSSDYYLYFRSYRYQSPLVQSAVNALDYQIRFYTGQPYCDVYLFRKGTSVPASIDTPGYYSNGLVSTPGFSGTFGAGSVLRVYFNGTIASTTAASWTAVPDSSWKNVSTSSIDDGYTAILTSANQSNPFSSPTPSDVTYSSGVFTINFTGGSGPNYQGWFQTDSGAIGTQPALTGTVDSTPDAPQSGGSFTSSPLTRTLTAANGYTYYWWVRSSLTGTGTGAGNVTAWSGPVSVTIPNATMTTAPTYGSATKTSNGFTASINNTPDPSGGTYTVVSNSNSNASTSITSGGAVTVTGLAASASNTVTVSYAKFGFTTVQFTVTGSALDPAVVLPGAPTGLGVSRSVGSDFLSTALNPSASGNGTKVQTWSFGRNTTFTISFTRGSNATGSEMYYSTSSSTPGAGTSANGGSSASASGSFSYVGAASTSSGVDTPYYFWVRSYTSTDKSAWTYAGTQDVDTPVYSAFSIILYRTSVGNSNFSTATPSRNDLTNPWTSVNTSFSHQAQVRLTFDGIARTANS